MGICLDTDASAAQDTGDQGGQWKGTQNFTSATRVGSVNTGTTDIQNVGKIKFDPPKVPVIFVLGGPGSGKVTHCDTFMQERRGVTHINMMDLLQQYAIGNDMQDFSQLSSKTVTEVLMLEMKMAPAAKTYIISGYPRSMRDVVEYSEKIQVVNGVILISWRQSVLQKQIDYGAKLGHVVLSLAKMELENFFKNVMPVADYFDQSDMLLAVNGERTPSEVYKDFRAAVLNTLNALENQEAILNGITGMGRGMNDIPGSIVSVETAPSQEKNITEIAASPAGDRSNNNSSNIFLTNAVVSRVASNVANYDSDKMAPNRYNDKNDHLDSKPMEVTRHSSNIGIDLNLNRIPSVIWVIGGPGSNKATLCLKAVGLNPGWGHISVGHLLRTITNSAPRANTESYTVKEALSAGDLAPEKAVNNLLDVHIHQLQDKEGIIIDGFPRNLQQVKFFETKYKQRPPVILLDCSKLQLGRGRIDDTVSSFRRRLEIFREFTLPMLKSMDNNSRLQIVDGDTDSPSVQREFEKIVRNHIQNFKHSNNNDSQGQNSTPGNNLLMKTRNNSDDTDAILQDLENNVPGAVPSISHHVSLLNGYLKNDHKADNVYHSRNNNKSSATKYGFNGDLKNRQPMNFRHMLEEAERYPVDSYM